MVDPLKYSDNDNKFTIVVTGGPYTYNTKEQFPDVKVYDGDAETGVDITSSCTITWPDGKTDVVEGNGTDSGTRINIKFNAPYGGETVRYYLIKKATPNLRLYNSYDMNTALTKTDGKYPDLYLALPNDNTESKLERIRTAITDFGVATISTTQTETILTRTKGTEADAVQGNANNTSGHDWNTQANFVAKGTSEGSITYKVNVPETSNYYGASGEFTVYVVTSEHPYDYKGYTQKFTCPATGEYLLEVWGAQGGWANDAYTGTGSAIFKGGPGGYVKAKIKLKKDEVLYVNVGEKGDVITWNYSKAGYTSYTKAVGYNAYKDPTVNTAGVTSPVQDAKVGQFATGLAENKVFVVGDAWNGGAGHVWGLRHHNTHSRDGWFCVRDPLSGGGGATDISLAWSGEATNWNTPEHLLTRIIVAGGGGGACYYSGEAGSGNGPSGGGGTQWAGFTTTIAVTDPGEGGKLWRGGYGGISGGTGGSAFTASNNDNITAARSEPIVNQNSRGYGDGSNPSFHYCKDLTNYYDGRTSGWSGADGVFGDGGYYYCIEEGSGAGGGGWYGGGAAGQSGGNGPAGGGSSYVWTNTVSAGGHTLDWYYKTAADLYAIATTATKPENAWNYKYKGSSVQNPSQRTYRYLYSVESKASANEAAGDSESANGKAKITCLSTSDTVDLGGRN